MIGIDGAAREAAKYYLEGRKFASRLRELDDSQETRAFLAMFETGREVLEERARDEKALEEAIQKQEAEG